MPEPGERAAPEHRPVDSADAGGTAPAFLVVGHVARAHGTRGELFVLSLTDRPDDVFAAGAELTLGDEHGAPEAGEPVLMVEAARPFKRGVLLSVEGYERREDADTLAQRYLLVPSETVPEPAEDELFYHELLGMSVVTVGGDDVGTVREVFETEPNHLLEVRGGDGRTRLIPFAARVVQQIDRAGRRLVIDPPEGLLEL